MGLYGLDDNRFLGPTFEACIIVSIGQFMLETMPELSGVPAAWPSMPPIDSRRAFG